jgi:hypothetical protein
MNFEGRQDSSKLKQEVLVSSIGEFVVVLAADAIAVPVLVDYVMSKCACTFVT